MRRRGEREIRSETKKERRTGDVLVTVDSNVVAHYSEKLNLKL